MCPRLHGKDRLWRMDCEAEQGGTVKYDTRMTWTVKYHRIMTC